MSGGLFQLIAPGRPRELDRVEATLIYALAAATSAVFIAVAFGLYIDGALLLYWFLGVVLAVSFLTVTGNPARPTTRSPFGWAAAALAMAISLYFIYRQPFYEKRLPMIDELTLADQAAAIVMMLLVLEATRRVIGFTLVAVVLVFLSYGVFGHLIEGPFSHRALSLPEMLDQLVFTSNGLFGSALSVAAFLVFVFVTFGALLDRCGGGDFFFDLANSLVGRQSGGPAKVAVVSSGLYGSISGSPTADVVTTGAFTIPLMVRTGLKPVYAGAVPLAIGMSPLDWHVHEMLYGYVAAAVAGFLLTAIPNWTGRLPVCGWPLAALAALWLAGRVAILASGYIGGVAAAAIDVSFLATLAAVAAREIVAGKNWRNLRVLIVLGVLIAGNVVFHAEVLTKGAADYGIRIAVSAVLALIMLIGGRIVPSFTNNWLARNNPGRLPVPFSRYDGVTIAVSALALMSWIALPNEIVTGVLLILAGVLQTVRLARWAGDRTFADRLVLVLHVAYFFVPLGFLLLGGSMLTGAVPATAGIHAWTAGAIGMMTLAVMTRATLGHTGQPLQASPATQAVYALVFASALLRIVAAFIGSMALIELAGLVWIAGFAGFVLLYGRLLARRKPIWAEARC
jgi:uncharacterized protein involved in response to NO